MFSNLYPVTDSKRPFYEYIDSCRAHIEERRLDLGNMPQQAEIIITANTPYELYPPHPIQSGTRLKYGALLIHGLLDSPFTLRDIGTHLQAQGIFSRSILLPGHGTQPSDLLQISYQDWIRAVQRGVDSLRQEVDQLFLIGYSTGAALSILHALQDEHIAGIILIAPAIKIKTPTSVILKWRTLTKWLRKKNQWLCRENEIDYAKYLSVSVNAVTQVSMLTDVISQVSKQQTLTCPLLMALSNEDETISSRHAIDFFNRMPHQDNQLLLYTSETNTPTDPRIQTRSILELHSCIKNFSHVSLPFAPYNQHYGEEGDFANATNSTAKDIIYGAYNRIEVDAFNFLYKLGMTKEKRRELTYNPDFDYLAETIGGFIKKY